MVIKGMKKAPIVFNSGDKGGTGKSYCTRAIASYLIANDLGVVGYDCDLRNGHLDRHLGQHIVVKRFSIRDDEEFTMMINSWQEALPHQMILVDMPGNVGDMVVKQRNLIRRAAEALGRDLFQVWVANEEEDSVWLLQEALKFVDPPQTIFVRNERFGEASKVFGIWDDSKTRAEFLEKGGLEGRLPRLQPHIVAQITRERLSFADVGPARLLVGDRINFDMWWHACRTEVDRWLKLLGEK